MSVGKSIQDEYPLTVDIDRCVRHTSFHPRGKKHSIPVYGAGFLVTKEWLNEEYLPRVGVQAMNNALSLSLDKHGKALKDVLHATSHFSEYMDNEDHILFHFVHNTGNFPGWKQWWRNREQNFEKALEYLGFKPEEISVAKSNFKWYMFPIGFSRVPPNTAIGYTA